MAHLSPEELLDVADGSRDAPDHLAACGACRRELDDVRAVMASIAGVDVPEPSPLFWDHFSARVGEAVAADGAPRRGIGLSWRMGAAACALAAAAAVTVALWVASPRNVADGAGQGAAHPAAPAHVTDQAADGRTAPTDSTLLADSGDDPSFAVVAGLADDINMDPAVAAGLEGDGAADHAVTHLTEGELRALAELLKEQIQNGRVS